MIKRFGWKRGIPIENAPKFSDQIQALATLPESVDLRPEGGPDLNQGDLGGCTANALADSVYFALKKGGKQPFVPSRLFIYYNERLLEGTPNMDSGASLSDGVRVLQRQGAPHESLWWYDTKKFKVRPNQAVYNDGRLHRAANCFSIDNTRIEELKACLASGFPFVFGYMVFKGMTSKTAEDTGVVPMPRPGESPLGGHAVTCYGYEDSHQWFIFKNWWGTDWGNKGYGYLPYRYLTNPDLADDFWAIRTVA